MAETTTHIEVPGGRGFPPFQSEHFASQLVWLAMSFVLLYVLMSRIALPRIGAIMAERGRLISEDLAAAERLKEQSNAANLAYETALADARARAQTIAGSTREQQLREAEEMHKRLESQLHERLADVRLSASGAQRFDPPGLPERGAGPRVPGFARRPGPRDPLRQ